MDKIIVNTVDKLASLGASMVHAWPRFKMWLYFKTHPYDKTVYESHKAAFGGNSEGKILISFGPANNDDRYVKYNKDKSKKYDQRPITGIFGKEPDPAVLSQLEPADSDYSSSIYTKNVEDISLGYIPFEKIEKLDSKIAAKEVEDAMFSKYTEGVTEPVKKPRRKAAKRTSVEVSVN